MKSEDILKIPLTSCEHIVEQSCYNNNFYRLPFLIHGFDVIHEKYNGAEDIEEVSLGFIENGQYVPKLYINILPMYHTSLGEVFLVNLDKLSKENFFT